MTYPLVVEDSGSGLQITEGNLLDTDCQYIAHQCNCRTRRADGLAARIFQKYPHTNDYKNSTERRPGTVIVHPPTRFSPGVLNLYAQDSPGRHYAKESRAQRLTWFKDCLSQVSRAFCAHKKTTQRRSKSLSSSLPTKIALQICFGARPTRF